MVSTIIAIVIIVVAVLVALRKLYKAISGKGKGCDSSSPRSKNCSNKGGCSQCPLKDKCHL